MLSPDQSLPFERAVTCDCDRVFHLPLALLVSPDSEPAHACVRCGRITCTEVLWTHIHHNTFEPHGRREHPLTDEARAWLDLWPRVLRGKTFDDYAFLPAAVRCTDVADLQSHVVRAFGDSLSLSRGRRLRQAGIPSEAPPASLPDRLKNYQILWERSQQLTPESDLEFLLTNARPVYRLTRPLALDALLQRNDLPEVFTRASASPEPQDCETVCALVQEDPSMLPLALPGLLSWLDRKVSQPGATLSDYRLQDLLNFLAQQRSAANQITPALEATKARLDRHAFEFSRKLTEAIRTLKGEEPLPISSKPWFLNS